MCAFILYFTVPATGSAQSGTIDPAFSPGGGANNRVFAMAQQPDGRQVLGGSFTNYNGTAINRLVRVTRTGLLDNTFSTGTGPNGQVTAIAVDHSGRILIGGSFSMYNGVQRARLARLNTDGTLDASFDIGTGMAGGVVNAIAVQPDGRVVVVGAFSGFNGSPQNKVVRLHPDGSRDASFNTGTGPNNTVYAVSIDADGRTLIGGAFATVNGVSRPGIARLTTTGAVDASFDPGAGVNNSVYAIAQQRDGRILIGGVFTNYNGSTPAGRIARLHRDGSYDTSFNTGTGFNSWVYTLTLQGDGKVLAGGDFTSYNGSGHNRLVRLNTNGSVDASFMVGSACNNWVYAITWQPEGRVTVAGGFTVFNGTAINRLVRLTSACDENVQLTVEADAFGSQTGWELLGEGFTYPICSGAGFANSTETTVSCCVPYGPLRLRVLDSAGDGMAVGGYVLKDATGKRIIDNTDDGVFGFVSSIAAGGAFFLPLGPGKPIFTACDKLDWTDQEYMVASEIPEVSAQWGIGDQTDDGYEFWWYDPDGGYTHRRFRNHATSDGFGIGALRACHQRLSWFPAIDPIPEGVLLNVKVRGRVNGVNMEWGPACRFKLDPAAAECPTTQLMNVPGNRYFSCGVTKPRNRFVTAIPVPLANRYEFEFTNVGLAYSHAIQSTTYHRYLNWSTDPLIPGQTYEVRVRASLDGGITFCPFGEPCTVTIAPAAQEGGSSMALQSEAVEIGMWPNPGNGERMELSLMGLPQQEGEIMITVFDAGGRVMHQQPAVTEGPQWRGTVSFDRTLPQGTYVLQAEMAENVVSKRFVVTTY